MIKDNLVFLREFFSEFKDTGSFFPTSKWAAASLSCPLNGPRRPAKILELGPGTGSVTLPIIRKMIPGDELAICEINPRFMASLKKKLSLTEEYQERKNQISFYECAIQDFPDQRKFDVIVCSLPFLNFDRKTVEDIFAKLYQLSTPQTVMTYYQFMGLRSLGKAVGSPKVRKRIADVVDFFDDTLQPSDIRREKVWLNVLPINVFTLKLAA